MAEKGRVAGNFRLVGTSSNVAQGAAQLTADFLPCVLQGIDLKHIFSDMPKIRSANFSLLFAPEPEINCYTSAIMKNSAKKAPRQVPAASVPMRPAAPGSHKFHVGQAVYFTAGTMGRPGASGSYQIVRLLPSDGDEHHYRIKSAGEAFERVAKESQLERDR